MGNGDNFACVVVIYQKEVELIDDLSIHLRFEVSLDFLAAVFVHVYHMRVSTPPLSPV